MKITKRIAAALTALAITLTALVSSSAFAVRENYTLLYYSETETLTLREGLSAEDVTFSSSDESVVRVDENGNIRTAGLGECTVYARVNETGETDECEVKVKFAWRLLFESVMYFIRESVTVR